MECKTFKKVFVLRPHSILSGDDATLRFGDDNLIVIPMAVLESIYKYDDIPEKMVLARKFCEYISSFKRSELISQSGAEQSNGSRIRLIFNSKAIDKRIQDIDNISDFDRRVFQTCFDLKREYTGKKITLISQNPTIRFKAYKIDIDAEEFIDELFPAPKDQYKGWIEVATSKEILSKMYSKNGFIDIRNIYKYQNIKWIENMFVSIKTESSSGIGRYSDGRIVNLQYADKLPAGVKSKNIEQTMFWECLLTPPDEAAIVICKGAAGTGKTFCSLNYALNSVKGFGDNNLFDQVLVATPISTIGNEKIGYLPGDIDEKVGPYLGGVRDNLRSYFRNANRDADNAEIDDMVEEIFERKVVEIQPIGFLRGRSITDTVFIIDETQNIEPSIIKDIVTRAGINSKFIFLGDPTQVNNPKLNSRYNGLVFLSERMKGNHLCRQITLSDEKSVRSTLAQEASKIL